MYYRKLPVTYREEQSVSDISPSCSAALPTVCSSFTNFASEGSNNFSHEQPMGEIIYVMNNGVNKGVKKSSIVEDWSAQRSFLPR